MAPLAANYSQQIVGYIATYLHAEVKVEAIDLKMVGVFPAPELHLTNLAIKLPNTPTPVHLKHIALRVDLLNSILAGSIRLAWLNIDNVKLSLRISASEQPLELKLDEDALPLDFILAQGPLLLTNGIIILERQGAKQLEIQPVTIKVTPGSDHINLGLAAQFSDGGELYLQTELYTKPQISSNFYLKTNNFRINTQSINQLPNPWMLNAVINTELWGNFNSNLQLAANGTIGLQQLNFDRGKHSQTRAITNLTSSISLHSDSQGNWDGGLYNIVWNTSDNSYYYPKKLRGELDFKWKHGDLSPKVRIAVANFHLQDALDSLVLLPLPESTKTNLYKLAPHGQVQNLRLQIETLGSSLQWNLGAKFSQLGMQPWQQIPGFNNLNMEVRANQAGGQILLNGVELGIDAPKVFRAPLAGLSLNGNLVWNLNPKGDFSISSQALTLKHADFTSQHRITLKLNQNLDPPNIDLSSTFNNISVAAIPKYLPVGVMKPPLIDWLDMALVAGTVKSGEVKLQGKVDDFPYRNRKGNFLATFWLDNTEINYEKQWPHLTQASGVVKFFGPGLAIDVHQGRILDTQVQTAQLLVQDIKPAPHLPITGQLVGPFNDVLGVLGGPLAEQYQRYVDGMQVYGLSKINMKIAIPIEPWAKLKLDGQIYWDGAVLKQQTWGMNLTDIVGNLHFTDDGLFAQNIGAKFGGEALKINVDTPQSEPGGHAASIVDVQVPLSYSILQTILPQWPWDFVAGRSASQLQLIINHDTDNRAPSGVVYKLVSDLRNVEIKLPAPLSKNLAMPTDLYVEGTIPMNMAHDLIVRYGDIKAILRFADAAAPKLVSGEILSNVARAPNPRSSGLKLNGRLPRVDIPGWIAWLNQHQQFIGEAAPSNPTLRVQADVQIDKLDLSTDSSIKNLNVKLSQQPSSWYTSFAASNIFGWIEVPMVPRSRPILAKFSRLQLDLSEPETTDTGHTELNSNPTSLTQPLSDPHAASGLDLQIERLVLGDQVLGTLAIQAVPEPNGLHITNISLNSESGLSVKGSGSWTGDSKFQDTNLHLSCASADFGRSLRSLGFSSAMHEASLQASADLHWSDAPQNLQLAQLEGNLQFDMGSGRIIDVNPGVGRLFGLLSIETLLRRLTLDFRDIFSKGFVFDKIKGGFTLRDGMAIADSVKINGPAASIVIHGQTDLINKQYNQMITVVPSVSSTLPIAGAIAGGPITAAAIILADRVVGDKVDNLIRLQYQLSGPWDKPNVTRVATTDGWSILNLLTPRSNPPQPNDNRANSNQ
ncbi:hypothetical protein TI04_00670 [Achromatium sp. WMS2]|nr:hypothetical protein TI04_00670 [Achromatium sp. WMS2]